MASPDSPSTNQLPTALVSRNPTAWFALFGPGAIVASLTIGTGELIFSTRGGALFGYRVLFLFVFISLLKWAMVFATARHMVLSGAHPFHRMLDLPGPRGWMTLLFLLLAVFCFPIWISFHSGVTGNLLSVTTSTSDSLNGATDYLWGMGLLAVIVVLSFSSGYSVLERVQLFIVSIMIVCAGITLILYNPDWLEILKGAFVPQSFEFPEWVKTSSDPHIRKIADHSVWIETTRYVGVIGGSFYDYLVYTTFLREKQWGHAADGPQSQEALAPVAADANHPLRTWIRAPLIDLTISFLAIVAFSLVFVASGAMFLGPEHQVPTESNLLELQSQFVTKIHGSLYPMYIAAAFLTMFGTLYGTLEVFCSIVDETMRALAPRFHRERKNLIRKCSIFFIAAVAFSLLSWMFSYQYFGWGDVDGTSRGAHPPKEVLFMIMTPANLFTGVLGCGLVCMMVPWFDRRFLPSALRMPAWLVILNLVSGVIFICLGLKGYWDVQSRTIAVCSILGVLVASFLLASVLHLGRSEAAED